MANGWRKTAAEEEMSEYERIAREALERAEKATEGPLKVLRDRDYDEWSDRSFEYVYGIGAESGKQIAAFEDFDEKQEVDAEYIVYACNNVPDLARAVLDQQAEIERLQSELRIEKASQATRGNA